MTLTYDRNDQVTNATLRYPPEHPQGIRQVQVGCGPYHHRPDWWNTDLRPFPNIDEAFDATKPWRWVDLLSFVYAEHFLEHLEIDQALAFLVEAGRALRVGGRIRLTTPSLEWVLRSHFTFPKPRTEQEFKETMETNRAFYGWGHRFLYSKGVLERALLEVGYQDVQFFRYGQSNTAAFTGIELHESSFDYDSQWIIEGKKGDAQIDFPRLFIAELEEKFLGVVRSGH